MTGRDRRAAASCAISSRPGNITGGAAHETAGGPGRREHCHAVSLGRPVAQQQHELLMLALGLASKREITRIRIPVRSAMAAQAREQGGYSEAARPTGTGSLRGSFRSGPEPRL